MTEPNEKITDGLATASTTDLIRHLISILVGVALSRLVKHNLLTGEEVSLLLGFLPSLIFNVGFSIWRRINQRKNIATALKMPEGSTVAELKSVLSNAAPVAVLSANKDEVVVVKQTEE